MSGRYQEYRPAPALRPYVECCWTISGADRRERVLPDGCMDVLFNLGDFPRSAGRRLRSFVVGAMPRAAVFDTPGRVELVGVRFRPGGAGSFLRSDAAELTGDVAPLDAFWRDAAELEERLSGLAPADRVRVLEGALLERVPDAEPADRARVREAARLVVRSGGAASVASLAEAAGWSERQLRRRYRSVVGLSPKQACRIERFRRATRLLLDPGEEDIARIAVRAGYYDQPHLNRDFRELAGLSPGQWLAERDGRFVQDGNVGAS